MNNKQAYEILGIDSSASEDEIRKAFRQQAAKHHPDKNKDPGAVDRFKEINNAYKFLTTPKDPGSDFVSRSWNSGISVVRHIQHPTLVIRLELSFQEAVLGCSKSIPMARQFKCEACGGNGFFSTHDNCSGCDGKGRKVAVQGTVTVVMNCPQCQGIGRQQNDCSECLGVGTKLTEKNFDVSLPGGLLDGQSVRLKGGGHYQSTPFGAGYSDAYISAKVNPEPNMRLVGPNVISTLELPLLEAVKGTTKTVTTVHGECELEIPRCSRNKDEVIKKGKGAVMQMSTTGDHIFVLDVKYPDDIEKLTKALE